MKSRDVLFGIGIIVFVCVFFTQTLELPSGPAMFPRLMLSIIFCSGVGIIVRSLWQQRKNKEDESAKKTGLKEFALNALLPAGILFLISFLMTYIGFYIGCFLLFIAIYVLEDVIIKGRFFLTRKEIAKLLVSTLGVVGFLFIFFDVLLKLPTPKGPWGF